MIETRLSSGLTVIAKHVPNRVVTLDAWVNAGSADEPPHLHGVTHFLEHMLFKGTARFGVGELDRAITAVGGVWNAGTSMDFTHYYVTVAAPFFVTALDAICDMLKDARIDATEFDKERHVILEEIRRKQDSPMGTLHEELYEVFYEQGPYRHPVLGTEESIRALTRDAMADYFHTRYTAGAITLVIVGDLPEDEAIARAADALGDFPRPGNPPASSPPATITAHGQRRFLPRDVTETYFALAFPAPGIADADAVLALDIASTLLSGGRSSRLYRTVKEDQQLVHSIGAGYSTHRYESMLTISGTTDRAKLDAACACATATARDFANQPPSSDEMAKARRIIRNDLFFSEETTTGQSGLIGYYRTLTGSNEFLDTYLARLDAVTPAAAAESARRCLAFEPTLVAVEPMNGHAA